MESEDAPVGRQRRQLLGSVRAALLRLAAPVGLGVFTLVVFLPQLRDGGFLIDDWWYAAVVDHPAPGESVWAELRVGHRYVTGAYFLGVFWIGASQTGHILWLAFTATLVSALVYAVLRRLGVPAFPAFSISAIILVFPWSSASALWVTSGAANIGQALALLGVLAALAAFDRGRDGYALHALSLLLYTAALLQSEANGGIVALGLVICILVAGWKAAAGRVAVDLVAVTTTLLFIKAGTPHEIGTAEAAAEKGRQIASQAVEILEAAGRADLRFQLHFAFVTGVVAAGAALSLRRVPSPARTAVRTWTLVALAGAALIVLSYAVYAFAEGYYVPFAEGIGNRVNARARIGYALLLVGFCALLAAVPAMLFERVAGIGRAERWIAVSTKAAPVIGAAVLAVGWISDTRDDMNDYVRANRIARGVMTTIEAKIPDPPPASTIYAFGFPKWTATAVPVFSASWDLTGALRLRFADGTLLGVPHAAALGVRCGSTGVLPLGPLFAGVAQSAYGRVFVVDVRANSLQIVRSRDGCLADLAPRFRPPEG